MKIGVIVQARMSSERFPGKVLTNIAGKPMLQYMMESIARCTSPDVVLVATSSEASDTPIEDFCRMNDILCFRGSLHNVAGRFEAVIQRENLHAFARICGDSPLLDHRLIDHAINLFREGHFEMVTNVLPRSFPVGQSVEVLQANVFKRAYRKMARHEDLEHVTRYFHRHQDNFSIRNFTSPEDNSRIRLCVDTPEDMNRITDIVTLMGKPHWEYNLAEILQFFDRTEHRLD